MPTIVADRQAFARHRRLDRFAGRGKQRARFHVPASSSTASALGDRRAAHRSEQIAAARAGEACRTSPAYTADGMLSGRRRRRSGRSAPRPWPARSGWTSCPGRSPCRRGVALHMLDRDETFRAPRWRGPAWSRRSGNRRTPSGAAAAGGGGADAAISGSPATANVRGSLPPASARRAGHAARSKSRRRRRPRGSSGRNAPTAGSKRALRATAMTDAPTASSRRTSGRVSQAMIVGRPPAGRNSHPPPPAVPPMVMPARTGMPSARTACDGLDRPASAADRRTAATATPAACRSAAAR